MIQHQTASICIFGAQIIWTLLVILISLIAPKHVLPANRILVVMHLIYLLIHTMFSINPINLQQSDSLILLGNMINFEFFNTLSINLLYLNILCRLNNKSYKSALLTSGFLILLGMISLLIINICELTIFGNIQVCVCKVLANQITHALIVVAITICMIGIVWKFHKNKLMTFVFHILINMIIYLILFPSASIWFTISCQYENPDPNYLRRLIIIFSKFYDPIFLFLLAYQHPQKRKEIKIWFGNMLRISQVHQRPQVQIIEPLNESNIALRLIRNPINSFYKLQRQTESRNSDESNSNNNFLNSKTSIQKGVRNNVAVNSQTALKSVRFTTNITDRRPSVKFHFRTPRNHKEPDDVWQIAKIEETASSQILNALDLFIPPKSQSATSDVRSKRYQKSAHRISEILQKRNGNF